MSRNFTRLLMMVAGLVLCSLAQAADVRIRWSAPTGCVDGTAISNCPVTGYAVRRATGTAAPVLLGSTLSSVFEFVDRGVAPGTYTYSVVASSDAGPSAPASGNFTVPAPVPGPPTNIIITIAQVPGASDAIVFNVSPTTLQRTSTVAGLIAVGRTCLVDPRPDEDARLFKYRTQDYYLVAQEDVRFAVGVTPNPNVAAPCIV